MSAASVRISWLRHGETESGGGFRGSLDDALTPLGWEQMRQAVAVRSYSWSRIVSSPLQRCARFAEELAQRLNLPLQLEPALQELHFGAWEGQSAAALMEHQANELGRFWADPYAFTPPQGEPVLAFRARIYAAIAALRERFDGEHLLLVSHAGVMRLLLADARGLPREHLLQVDVPHGALFHMQFDAANRGQEI